MKKIEIQKVYVPVKVNSELPTENVLCIAEEWDGIAAGKLEINSKGIVSCDTDAIGCAVNYISHYLKVDKLITFTPEEYNKHIQDVIKDALKTVSKEAKVAIIHDDGWHGTDDNGWTSTPRDNYIVNKQAITNTFEQTFEKWKI